MRGIASLIMHGRIQAVLVIVLTALVPLLNLFSGAALALVTLRKGAGEGLIILLMSTCAAGVLLGLLSGSVTPALALLGVFWLPLWILAAALRQTVSLAITVQLAAVMTGVLLLGYLLVLEDPTAWARALLDQFLEPLIGSAELTEPQRSAVNQLEDMLAPIVLGLLFANALATLLLSLLLGRWWQALLFNPGGFRDEFHGLRLGRTAALVAAAVFALSFVTDSLLVNNLALLLVVVYTLQGLALVHGAAGRAKLAVWWLVGLYVLMVFALPQVIAILCLLGVIDAWLDFRARIPAGK